jgi:hypothetical protein
VIVDLARVVAEARSHIGEREATGHNDGPFVRRVLGGEEGLAWCAAFVLRVYEWAGFALPVNFWTCRRVSTLFAELDERGAVLSAHDLPAPGDLAFWLGHAHASAGPSGHVGVVVETGTMTVLERDQWRTVRTIDVVEGNSGNAVRLRRYLHGEPGQPTAYARPSKVVTS